MPCCFPERRTPCLHIMRFQRHILHRFKPRPCVRATELVTMDIQHHFK